MRKSKINFRISLKLYKKKSKIRYKVKLKNQIKILINYNEISQKKKHLKLVQRFREIY